jgi:23S rRNA (uridine2552-2'-O)-methyltransferase
VVSDAVPDFIGDRFVDHIRAATLNKEIIDFCYMVLKPGGNLLMKIIQGPADKELTEYTQMWFKSVQKVKPSASRNDSSETYVLCQGFDQSEEE